MNVKNLMYIVVAGCTGLIIGTLSQRNLNDIKITEFKKEISGLQSPEGARTHSSNTTTLFDASGKNTGVLNTEVDFYANLTGEMKVTCECDSSYGNMRNVGANVVTTTFKGAQNLPDLIEQARDECIKYCIDNGQTSLVK